MDYSVESISAMLAEFGTLLGKYFGYIAVLAVILIILRSTTKIPDYIFRKLLHVVAFTSILPLVFWTDKWWIAVLVEITFLIVIIIALHCAEGFPFYKTLLVEKGKHEVITSFVLLFGLMTILMAVFWGFFGDGHKYIAVASIMAWGPGDAAAAIVGKNWGRHKLTGKWIEGTKSVEGTVAMGIASFLCTLGVLVTISGIGWAASVALSLIIAPIAAWVELNTRHGLDTITVPIAASLILLAYMLIFG